MPEELAKSLEVLVPAFQNLHQSLEADRALRLREKRWVRFLLLVSVLEFLIVCVTFPSLFLLYKDANNTQHAVNILQHATGPKAQVKQAETLNDAIVKLLLCDDVHQDRDTELILHLPLRTVPSICPNNIGP